MNIVKIHLVPAFKPDSVIVSFFSGVRCVTQKTMLWSEVDESVEALRAEAQVIADRIHELEAKLNA
jgi:hypothetical protein